MKKASFLKKNGLSLALLIIFLLFWIGQAFTGWHVYNEELIEENASPVSFPAYLESGHFLSATFENWESEFLQMFVFVVFSIFLYQIGSPESKELDTEEVVDELPNPRKSPHWMVQKGGIFLWIYANSLSIILFLFFLCSFAAHSFGSYRYHEKQEMLKSQTPKPFWEYIASSNFWFESFQNWQSEFMAVFVIVYFTVFLRQQGSSQSKRVDALDSEYE